MQGSPASYAGAAFECQEKHHPSRDERLQQLGLSARVMLASNLSDSCLVLISTFPIHGLYAGKIIITPHPF